MNHVQHRQIKTRVNLIRTAEKWGTGLDTTGEGLHEYVPEGHIRILDSLANYYKEGGCTVLEEVSIPFGSGEKRITLVDLRIFPVIPIGYLEPFPRSRKDTGSDSTQSTGSDQFRSRSCEGRSDQLAASGS